jgi:small multidrug resistance pump
MAYLFLFSAIAAEVAATSLLKSTAGFSRLGPTLVCLGGYGASLYFLAMSISHGMRTGVAYAIWAALGTMLIVFISVLFFGEPISIMKTVGVALIVVGVVTLNLAGAH